MNKETTSIRLKKIMDERNLRQVDILNLAKPYCDKYDVKMNKSDLSQYCSGKTEPNQEKLFILGKSLNVNEAWLMGFDVPIERPTDKQRIEESNSYGELESMIANEARKLNQKGKIKLLDTAREMACNPLYNPDYKVELAAAHERTDTKVTEESRIEDDAIMHDDSEWE